MSIKEDPNWPIIIAKGEIPNINRNVRIKKANLPAWEKIKREHPGNFYMTSMFHAIYALAITPGGRSLVPQTQAFDKIKVQYQTEASGDIKILFLYINEQQEIHTKQAPGLYNVKSKVDENRVSWLTSDLPQTAMDLSHQWSGAHTAAVAGKFPSKELAGQKLFDHIINAYTLAIHADDVSKVGNHYSLVWLNNEFGNNNYVKNLVSMIQNAQKKNAKIRWLVQGEGAGFFVRALEFIRDNPISSQVITAQKGLQNQTVFFSNPRGKNTSEKKLEVLCNKVGIHYGGTNINVEDFFHSQDARHAVWEEIKTTIPLFGIGGMAGITSQGFLLKSVDMAAEADNLATKAGLATCGVWLAYNVATKYGSYSRHIEGLFSSTFGTGNQSWKE